MRKWGILLSLGIVILAIAAVAHARGGTNNGCYVCEWDGFMDDHCAQVGHNQSGLGISCYEVANGWSHDCVLEGGACLNTDVHDDDPYGGGGSGYCTYEGGYCPPSCMSCSGGTGGGGYVY